MAVIRSLSLPVVFLLFAVVVVVVVDVVIKNKTFHTQSSAFKTC